MSQMELIPEEGAPRRRRGRRPQLHFWAGEIFKYIPASGTGLWIHAKDIARLSGLTTSQVYRAIAYIRDTFPEFALISDISRGYRFSASGDEFRGYMGTRGEYIITHLQRIWTGAYKPYLEQQGYSPRQVEREHLPILQMIARIQADMVETEV